MRHPEYEGRYPSFCCEEAPDAHGFGITYACNRRVGHWGKHKATTRLGTVVAKWPKEKLNQP